MDAPMSIEQLIARDRAAAWGGPVSTPAGAATGSAGSGGAAGGAGQGLRALLPIMRSIASLAEEGAFASADTLLEVGGRAGGASNGDSSQHHAADGQHGHAAQLQLQQPGPEDLPLPKRRSLQMLVVSENGTWQPLSGSTQGAAAALQAFSAPAGPGGPGPGPGDGGEEDQGMVQAAEAPATAGPLPAVQQQLPVEGGKSIYPKTAAAMLKPVKPVKPALIVELPHDFKGSLWRGGAAARGARSSGLPWRAGAFGSLVTAAGFSDSQASELVSQRVGQGQVMYVDSEGNAISAPPQGASGGDGGFEQVHAFAAGTRRALLGKEEAAGEEAADMAPHGWVGEYVSPTDPGRDGVGEQSGAARPIGGGGGGGYASLASARSSGSAGAGAHDLTGAFKRLVGPKSFIVGPHREDDEPGGAPGAASSAAAAPPRRRRRLQLLIVSSDGSLQPVDSSSGSSSAGAAATLVALAPGVGRVVGPGGNAADGGGPGPVDVGSEVKAQAGGKAVGHQEGSSGADGATRFAASESTAPITPVNVPKGFKAGSPGVATATASGAPADSPAAASGQQQAGSFSNAVGTGGVNSSQAADAVRQRVAQGRVEYLNAQGAVIGDKQQPGGYGGAEQVHAFAAGTRRAILEEQAAGPAQGNLPTSGSNPSSGGQTDDAVRPAGVKQAGGTSIMGSFQGVDMTQALKALQTPRGIIVGPHREQDDAPEQSGRQGEASAAAITAQITPATAEGITAAGSAPGAFGGPTQHHRHQAQQARNRQLAHDNNQQQINDQPQQKSQDFNQRQQPVSPPEQVWALAPGIPHPVLVPAPPQRLAPTAPSTPQCRRGRALQQATATSPSVTTQVVAAIKVSGFASSSDATNASTTFRSIIANGTLASTLAAQGWTDASISLVTIETGSTGGSLSGLVSGLSPLKRAILIAAVAGAGGVVVVLIIAALLVRRMRRAASAQLVSGRAAAAAVAAAAAGPQRPGSAGAFLQPRSRSAYVPGYPPQQDYMGYPSVGYGPVGGDAAGGMAAGYPPMSPTSGYPPSAPVMEGYGGGPDYPRAYSPLTVQGSAMSGSGAAFQRGARASAPPGSFYPQSPYPPGQRQGAQLAVNPQLQAEQWGQDGGYLGGQGPGGTQRLASATSPRRGASPRATGSASDGGVPGFPADAGAFATFRLGSGTGGGKGK